MTAVGVTPQELAGVLEKEIADLDVGTRIDGEHALARRFGVTRTVVRLALASLESRFMLRRVRGSGTFVARRIDIVMTGKEPPSLHSVLEASGATLRTRVSQMRERVPPTSLADILGIEAGVAVRCLSRLGMLDDVRFSWAEEWLAPGVAPDIDAGLGVIESVYEILRAYGHDPQRALTVATVEHPTASVSERLGYDEPVPTWLVQTRTKDADGRMLMVSHTWMRLDTVRLVVAVGDEPTG